MRLIDADELKDIINGSEEFVDWQKREICECVDACETAYDVDKVVEQLEKSKSLLCRLRELKDRDYLRYGYQIERISDDIEIVKAGGKE